MTIFDREEDVMTTSMIVRGVEEMMTMTLDGEATIGMTPGIPYGVLGVK